MRNIKISIALMLLITLLIGCKKSAPENQGNTLLYKESINNIKKGEPVSLTFGNDEVTTKVVWTINPNANNTISTIANNATITFIAAGVYTVTASMGSVYAQYIITVDNIAYTPDYGTTFTMTTSKFVNIKQNESVLFSVHNTTASSIGWGVFPSDSTITIVRDNINKTATLTFAKPGLFAIYATVGNETIRRTILIDDANNPNPNLINTSFILGDKLQLTPSLEQVGGTKKLVITAKTTRKYNCSTDKILSFSVNNDYQIDYAGLTIASETCGIRSVANCVNSFKNMTVGVHPFTINFQNKTYTGTITLSANGTYTFDWQNNSEVSIFPLVL
jgi:hypothetical protein